MLPRWPADARGCAQARVVGQSGVESTLHDELGPGPRPRTRLRVTRGAASPACRHGAPRGGHGWLRASSPRHARVPSSALRSRVPANQSRTAILNDGVASPSSNPRSIPYTIGRGPSDWIAQAFPPTWSAMRSASLPRGTGWMLATGAGVANSPRDAWRCWRHRVPAIPGPAGVRRHHGDAPPPHSIARGNLRSHPAGPEMVR